MHRKVVSKSEARKTVLGYGTGLCPVAELGGLDAPLAGIDPRDHRLGAFEHAVARPESKHQTPSSKHQRNPKFQALRFLCLLLLESFRLSSGKTDRSQRREQRIERPVTWRH